MAKVTYVISRNELCIMNQDRSTECVLCVNDRPKLQGEKCYDATYIGVKNPSEDSPNAERYWGPKCYTDNPNFKDGASIYNFNGGDLCGHIEAVHSQDELRPQLEIHIPGTDFTIVGEVATVPAE